MKAIFLKDFKQFLNNLSGLLTLVIFLLLNWLFLFFFADSNLLDYGFVSLDFFFDLTPFTLLFLISAITMRLFADEFKAGTFELLATRPLTYLDLILGKFFASLLLIVLALIPTLVYAFCLSYLSLENIGFDKGMLASSYFGLLLLAGTFVSIGLFCSSLTDNSIVSFLLSVFICYALYDGCDQVVALNGLSGSTQFILENMGISYHYNRLTRGVLDLKDLVYFGSMFVFFTFLTLRRLLSKQ